MSERKKYPDFRPVKTVGSLARQLAKLPPGLPLSEAMRVVVYNTGACPKGWDAESFGPEVGIEVSHD